MSELSRLYVQSTCDDRNHRGLRSVLSGARLPNADLGQDAALAAQMLGSLERKLAAAEKVIGVADEMRSEFAPYSDAELTISICYDAARREWEGVK